MIRFAKGPAVVSGVGLAVALGLAPASYGEPGISGSLIIGFAGIGLGFRQWKRASARTIPCAGSRASIIS